jgi:hypothetical protein
VSELSSHSHETFSQSVLLLIEGHATQRVKSLFSSRTIPHPASLQVSSLLMVSQRMEFGRPVVGSTVTPQLAARSSMIFVRALQGAPHWSLESCSQSSGQSSVLRLKSLQDLHSFAEASK